jgi:uncharacterized protein (TIGR02118 family)
VTRHVVGALSTVPPVFKRRTDVVERPTDIAALMWIPIGNEPPARVAAGFDQAWLVESRVQWDGATPVAGRVVPGFKQISFLRRAPEITREEFATHWTDVHAPLARLHHPALWRYTQNVVIRPLRDGMADDVDGIAELTMRLRLDFSERMYDSPEGRRIVGADVRKFLDLRASRMVWAREHSPSV